MSEKLYYFKCINNKVGFGTAARIINKGSQILNTTSTKNTSYQPWLLKLMQVMLLDLFILKVTYTYAIYMYM